MSQALDVPRLRMFAGPNGSGKSRIKCLSRTRSVSECIYPTREAHPAFKRWSNTMKDVEWQARRVAAAFGVKEWRVEGRTVVQDDENGRRLWEKRVWDFDSVVPDDRVSWCLDATSGELCWIEIGVPNAICCSIWRAYMSQTRDKWKWGFSPEPRYHELMARGLYCLGFDDPSVLAKLGYPLTGHEQIELRLSIPPQFWPQKWLKGAPSAAVDALADASRSLVIP